MCSANTRHQFMALVVHWEFREFTLRRVALTTNLSFKLKVAWQEICKGCYALHLSMIQLFLWGHGNLCVSSEHFIGIWRSPNHIVMVSVSWWCLQKKEHRARKSRSLLLPSSSCSVCKWSTLFTKNIYHGWKVIRHENDRCLGPIWRPFE